MDRAPDIKCVRDDSIRGSETDTFCLTLGRSLDHFLSSCCYMKSILWRGKRAGLSLDLAQSANPIVTRVFQRWYLMQIDNYVIHTGCMPQPEKYAKLTLLGPGMAVVIALEQALHWEEEKYHFTICLCPEQCDSICYVY